MKKADNILIATGIYPPKVGGIAQYARHLKDSFKNRGINATIATYGIEHRLLFGIRHFVYFVRLLFIVPRCDFILVLDTVSTGIPALCASLIFRKKIIIRLGGDFLWESYVNRTHHDIPLSRFYLDEPQLSFKEKIIFYLTRFLLRHVNTIVFSTQWQKDIYMHPYALQSARSVIIENYYAPRGVQVETLGKKFLWAGRSIHLKNTKRLQEAFALAQKRVPGISLEMIFDEQPMSQEELLKKIKESYAIIQPSISDVSPNFILEGLSFSKPFILTIHSGFTEKLQGLGLFVDPLSVSDIQEKVESLAQSEIYEQCKKNIEKFSYTHSWNDIADEFLVLFKNV